MIKSKLLGEVKESLTHQEVFFFLKSNYVLDLISWGYLDLFDDLLLKT